MPSQTGVTLITLCDEPHFAGPSSVLALGMVLFKIRRRCWFKQAGLEEVALLPPAVAVTGWKPARA